MFGEEEKNFAIAGITLLAVITVLVLIIVIITLVVISYVNTAVSDIKNTVEPFLPDKTELDQLGKALTSYAPTVKAGLTKLTNDVTNTLNNPQTQTFLQKGLDVGLTKASTGLQKVNELPVV